MPPASAVVSVAGIEDSGNRSMHVAVVAAVVLPADSF